MTREDIRDALDAQDKVKLLRGYTAVIDFALEMVRRHHEELLEIANDCATIEILRERFGKAKP